MEPSENTLQPAEFSAEISADPEGLFGSIGGVFRGGVKTVGDFFNVGKRISGLIDDIFDPVNGLVDKLDDTVRGLLEEVNRNINEVLQNISSTYQDNLNITIDRLDSFTSSKIIELTATFENLNSLIQDDIKLLGDTAADVLDNVNRTVKQATLDLEESFKKVIVVAGEAVTYVLDRTVYNILTLVSWGLLGVGLLVFVILLVTGGLPGGFAGVLTVLLIFAFLGLFGVVALAPKLRARIMQYTGYGLQQTLEQLEQGPRVIYVKPEVIMLGTTQEVEVWGSSLLVEGQAPAMTIGGVGCTVKASSEDRLVGDASHLDLPSGSTNLILTYPEGDPVRLIVRIDKPVPEQYPDLRVSRFTLEPPTPEAKSRTLAQITISNVGPADAGRFTVKWKPDDQHTGISHRVDGLDAGKQTDFTLDYTYPKAGDFSSLVAVDTSYEIEEVSEANNVVTRNMRVLPHQPRLVHNVSNFQLPQNGEDQDTGITVGRGDRVRIEVRGRAQAAKPRRQPPYPVVQFGPEGSSISAYAHKVVLSSVKQFAVLYSLNGQFVEVGRLFDGKVNDNGKLFLRSNGGVKSKRGVPLNVAFTCHIRVWR